jgi:hypothetical protein
MKVLRALMTWTVVHVADGLTCPKGTQVIQDGTACEDCPSGQFTWREHSPACNKCPSGSTSNAARTSCEACPAGTFNNEEGGACRPCFEGEVAKRPRAVTCFACPPGTTSEPLVGGTQCVNCPAGRFSHPNNEGCFDCPEGQFSATEGSAKCEPCLGGETACNRETGKVEFEVEAAS